MHDETVYGFQASPLQESLWARRSGATGPFPFTQAVARIEGNFDPAALERAVGRVVGRHEILRTRMAVVPGTSALSQIVEEHGGPAFSHLNWGLKSGDEQRQSLDELIKRERSLVDPERCGALRVVVASVGATAWLIASAPAVLADERSLKICLGEIAECYNSSSGPAGQPPQYADLAAYYNDILNSEAGAAGLQYWREQVPTQEAVRLSAKRAGAAEWQAPVESPLFKFPAFKLSALADACNATEEDVLLACWQILIVRLAGARDLVLSWVGDGRGAEEQRAVGLFSLDLPFRTTLSPGCSVASLARMNRQKRSELSQWQATFRDFPEFSIRDSDRMFPPLSFHYSRDGDTLRLGQAGLKIEGVISCASRFELQLSIRHGIETIEFAFRYAPDLFTGREIDRLGSRLQVLLSDACAQPEAPMERLRILPPAEEQTTVYEWNRFRRPYEAATVLECFERQAARNPDSIAVVAGEVAISYGQLNRLASEFARSLRLSGVQIESRVGVCMRRSPRLIVAMLSCWKAGAAFVPLDPALPSERLSYMLRDSGASVIISDESAVDLLKTISLPQLRIDVESRTADEVVTIGSERPPSRSNLAYLIYTSGSTGIPKAVAIEHRQLNNYVAAVGEELALAPGMNFAALSSVAADLGNTTLFPALCRAGCLYILGEDEARDSLAVADAVSRYGIDVVKITPTHFNALCDNGVPPIPSTRLVLGGEVLPLERARAWAAARPGCQVWNHYGPTECAVGAVMFRVRKNTLPGEVGNTPLGKPLANAQVYVVDPEGRPAPIGVEGELLIGGAGVGRGYWNRPSLTAERFTPDPFSPEPGARLYRSGDRACWREDGTLEFRGRQDGQIKFHGYRIELGEIEVALSSIEGVRQAAVTLQEGEGDGRLVGYVVSDASYKLDPAILRAALKARLPEYMIPAGIVPIERLPLLPNGKLDRKRLPKWELEESQKETAPPATPIEEIISGVWGEVLRRNQVGVNENFFELGGHSLLATQVVSRVRKVLGIEIALSKLFENPTVRALAAEIELEQLGGAAVNEPLLEPGKRGGGLPLSFAQRRLWFLDQLEPDSPLYNMPHALRLEGDLDRRALEASLGEIVRRHQVLRTRFESAEDGGVEQYVNDAAPLRLGVVDLTAMPHDKRERIAGMIARQEARRPFRLHEGKLLGSWLARLDERDHALFLNIHHIAADGWSLGVLVREMGALYESFWKGEGAGGAALPDLPIQYTDFAAWQRRWLSGQTLERQLEYWRNQLEGAAVLEMPTDHPRPAALERKGRTLSVHFSPELSRNVDELSRKEGATMFMALLATWQIVLGRYAGQQDVVVGTDVANRNRLETEGLIGFFINQLVLRTELSSEESFRDMLNRVKRTTLDAYARQDVPFELLVDELAPARDLNRMPLFQSKFVFQNYNENDLRLPGLNVRAFGIPSESSRFDLTLLMRKDSEGCLTGSLQYATELFEEETIRRLVGAWQTALTRVTARPEVRVGEIELIEQDERDFLLRRDVERLPAQAASTTLPALFEACAGEFRHSIAVTQTHAQMSYGELDRRSNRLARHLRSLGVAAEVRVAICLERSPEMFIAILGVLKSGGAYTPLDPSYPSERLNQIIDDAQCPVIITERALLGKLPGGPVGLIQPVLIDESWPQIERESDSPVHITIPPDAAAYVIFTSGSTGRPKGVCVSHGGAASLAASQRAMFALEPGKRSLQFASPAFDAVVWEWLMAFCSGGTLILPDSEHSREGTEFAELLDRMRVEIATVPPPALTGLTPADFPALRSLVVAGEPCPPALACAWGAGRDFFNAYGPTETTVCATISPPLSTEDAPIGRAIPGTYVFVLDEQMRLAPRGFTGELYVGGAGVARGYLNRPALTAERFLPDPFRSEPGARLYRTGDLARWRLDGQLEYRGRIDQQVKLRGYRIELGEVEAALGRCAGVSQAVAVVRDDGGHKRLIAFVVGERGVSLNTSDIRRQVGDRLPAYMIPHAIAQLERLPLSPNGKIDRKALPAIERRSAPEDSSQAPRTETERLIAEIWGQALHKERVGVDENFFELGGDSILSIQIIARMRQAGLHATVRQIFQNQTVAELARSLEPDSQARMDATQAAVICEVELTPMTAWFFEREWRRPSHYNQAVLLRPRAPVDPAALAGAIEAILRHHDALRLRCRGGRCSIADIDHASILVNVDLSAAPDRHKAFASAVRQLQESLDLEQGPIARVGLIRMGDGEERLLWVIHHLAVDGVSWRILLDDIERAYGMALQNQAIDLGLKTHSFAQWAAAQNQYAAVDHLIDQIDYWKEIALVEVGSLPRDGVNGHYDPCQADVVAVDLDPDETRALVEELPRRYGAGVREALLLALTAAVSRCTGYSHVRFDTEGHGREEFLRGLDVSRTVGWFTSLYPVVLTDQDATLEGRLAVLSESIRRIPDNGQSYGLLRYLHQDPDVRKSLCSSEGSEILFNYLGQFDATFGETRFFARASESVGPTKGSFEARPYPLEVSASILNGTLSLAIRFSPGLHGRTTIEELLHHMRSELETIASEARELSDAPSGETRLEELLAGMVVHRTGG
jgi:amino acid adenylation domain-containing protein/non-ribosomal peptide synthase protein (TIGR01720 family)